MNRTELAWANELESMRVAGVNLGWRFEAVRLRLGGTAFYTPDFLVVAVIGGHTYMELHEVKGFWREAALVRIKTAASAYPWFRFKVIRKKRKKDGGGFDVQTVDSRPLSF
jgi:hypothetical protein